MAYKKPRTTTKHSHPLADGHLPGRAIPSAHDPHKAIPREHERLTNITIERCREDKPKLGCRMTKFTQNFSGQVKIPKVIDPGRGHGGTGDQRFSERFLDVGQVPED